MKLAGANLRSPVEGLDELSSKSNYLIGNDPSRWRTNIANYAKVRYHDVYPGVDLIYYGNHKQLEYDFVVAPGADPNTIKWDFKNMRQIGVGKQGDLVLNGETEQLIMHKPVVYQIANSVRHDISSSFRLEGEGQVGFRVAKYDTSLPLIIDPTIVFSTFLGGSDRLGIFDLYGDEARAVATDGDGNVYLAGVAFTGSSFPITTGVVQPTHGSSEDGFVAKMSADGSRLFWCTYVGGGSSDSLSGIALTPNGDVVVAGDSFSSDFPLKSPFQSSKKGDIDAVLVRLSSAGSSLVFATYFGGAKDDRIGNFFDKGSALAVTATGDAIIAGTTTSSDLPLRNAMQQDFKGTQDAFVSRFSAAGELVYSTYLGGDGADGARAVAIDTGGNAYVTGGTSSLNFWNAGGFQKTLAGSQNAFVTKLSASGALLYSTYLGGSKADQASGIAVGSDGAAYVTGYTISPDFPTVNAFQSAYKGDTTGTSQGDAFLAKIAPSGAALVYSTYLGGSRSERSIGVAVDSAGNAYITGATNSPDFPVKASLQQYVSGSCRSGCIDAFVAQFDPAGSQLVFSTYLGGSVGDQGAAIAVDNSCGVYVAGYTNSSDFPVQRALQRSRNGDSDAFITKIDASPCSPRVVVNSGGVVNNASYAAQISPGSLFSIFGNNMSSGTTSGFPIPLPTSSNGTAVTVNGIATPLLYVSPTLINAQVPMNAGSGTATVTVSFNGTSASTTVEIVPASPGFFFSTSNGVNVGLAQHSNGTFVTSANPARPGETVGFYGTGIGPVSPAIGSGQGAGSAPNLSVSSSSYSGTINGVSAPISFVGLRRVSTCLRHLEA